MQGGRINTGQSQAKWVITTLNNLTNIRYTWQHNLKGRPQHHSHNNAPQCTDLCAELSFPVTSSERKSWTLHRRCLSFPPITDINNLHITPNFHDPWLHHPITERGTWKGALMRLSRDNLLHLPFPNVSFLLPHQHFWIIVIICLIWPPEIWWAEMKS